MRIGIDARALTENKITGVQVYLINLIDAMARQKPDYEFILFVNSFSDPRSTLHKFNLPNVNYRVFRLPNKIFTLMQSFLRFPKIDRMLGGVNVFFSPHWRSLALTEQTPLIVTFHDLAFEIFPEYFSWKHRFWHWLMNYRNAARRARKIIAVSKNTKNDIKYIYGTDENKISVIYPGTPNLHEPPKKPKENIPEKYFLAFGTFEPRKNLQAVIAAYEQYISLSPNPISLVMAGSTGWDRELMISPKLNKHITLLNDLKESEKTYLYKNAFAFLFLSFYEGFGFPVLEAARAGIPIIASLTNSLQETVGDCALFVSPFRPSQTAQAMYSLQNDQSLYESLRQGGEIALSRFTWDKSAKSILNEIEGQV